MFSAMTVIIVVISVLYIAYIVGEHFYIAAKRKKLKTVVHVNGIRGKSTVTRLIDAGLRGCGYKVFCKTTGTVPSTIDVENNVKPVRRLGPANIREQMRVIRWAAKQNADVLVVECMAVNPELQYICENRILHADVNVITNVREDHLDEMGGDLESIAISLANTVPQNGSLVLGSDSFYDIFAKCANMRNSSVTVAKPYTGSELLDTFPDNIAVALGVCDVLGLDREKFFNGMRNYVRDVGALAAFRRSDTVFINGFSANDPESTFAIYRRVTEKYPAENVTVLLNARQDRPFRVKQHIEMIKSMTFGKLILTGANKTYISKRLKQENIIADTIKNPEDLLKEKVIFGCGNIASDGMKILEYFKDGGTEIKL